MCPLSLRASLAMLESYQRSKVMLKLQDIKKGLWQYECEMIKPIVLQERLFPGWKKIRKTQTSWGQEFRRTKIALQLYQFFFFTSKKRRGMNPNTLDWALKEAFCLGKIIWNQRFCICNIFWPIIASAYSGTKLLFNMIKNILSYWMCKKRKWLFNSTFVLTDKDLCQWEYFNEKIIATKRMCMLTSDIYICEWDKH